MSENTDNTVYIGKKPVMNYVRACMTQIQKGAKKIVIKGRGRAIVRAVDCAEILRREFIKDAVISDIKITTESIERSEGGKTKKSAIEITLSIGE